MRTRPDGRGQTPDGWTPDGWTPGRLDTGRLDSRIPDADTGWVDTACWTPATDAVAACWQCRPRRPRPTSRYRLDAAPGRRRLGEHQPGPLSGKDAEGTHAAINGSGRRRDRQLPVVRRRPTGALAHCCPRKRLGSRVARYGDWHPLWQVPMSVDRSGPSGGGVGRGMECSVG